MKTCFSEGKLIKQYGKPPLSKRTPTPPPPPLSTPLFLSNFFMTPLFVQISKTRTSLPNFRVGGNYGHICLFFPNDPLKFPNFSGYYKFIPLKKFAAIYLIFNLFVCPWKRQILYCLHSF